MNRNSLNVVNFKLIGGGGQNRYLNPYKIKDYKEFDYRKLSRNR